MARKLPKLVVDLCYGAEAWVVGSAIDDDDPRDWDIVVPYTNWHEASHMIPHETKANGFGGFKCESEGHEVDVWPDSLGNLMTNYKVTDLWHPKSGKVFRADD